MSVHVHVHVHAIVYECACLCVSANATPHYSTLQSSLPILHTSSVALYKPLKYHTHSPASKVVWTCVHCAATWQNCEELQNLNKQGRKDIYVRASIFVRMYVVCRIARLNDTYDILTTSVVIYTQVSFTAVYA